MKFSENWLREHVPTTASREQLATMLTSIGLEVEALTPLGEALTPLGEALDGVVVAQITACAPHPQADRLQVCQVDAGHHGPLQIVCGAPNARPGLKAPLATIGTQVGEMTIRAAKLRGVDSSGMLCSAKELGLDADASGLLELPDDAPVGTPLAAYLGLPDAAFELKLTPNRADCFSVRGIAFDVAAATGSTVAPLQTAAVVPQSETSVPVQLQAGAAAPRYVGRVIEQIDANRPTPVWMAERLRRSGVRPVSLLVDITQYVMLELGQPMHAYDRDRLQGPIGVRHARPQETLQLLDGRTVTLDADFLLITDADRPVGLAGIMGGEDTKVSGSTRTVLLEAAHFAPGAIIGRARKLGLHTDAGHRFERGVDPELPRIAMERATALVLEHAGGVPGPLQDTTLAEQLPQPVAIPLRRARLARVLGTTVADAEITRILNALGLQVQDTADGWQVTAPPRRFDLAIEEDLIEEVARIHGYDAIPDTLPGGATRIVPASETVLPEADIRRRLAARDYLEAVNYAFVDAALLQHWQLHDAGVQLANPLSAELGVMRTALLPGLVAALARNAARQQERVRLFEIGNVFSAPQDHGDAPSETLRVAVVATGPVQAAQWDAKSRAVDFHDVKGDLQALAALSGAELAFEAVAPAWGHPGRSARVLRVDGVGEPRIAGWIAQLHPALQQTLDIDQAVIAFELDLGVLRTRAVPRARALSRYPSVRRDLAFVLNDAVPWAAVQASVCAAAGPMLRQLQLFDRYTGAGVESGRKSLAIGLILQDESRTLTDSDVDAVVADVIAALQRDHGASIRA